MNNLQRFWLVLVAGFCLVGALPLAAQSTDVDLPDLDPAFAESLADGTLRLTFYRTADEMYCDLDPTEQFIEIADEGIYMGLVKRIRRIDGPLPSPCLSYATR